jgi:hypothetical protein
MEFGHRPDISVQKNRCIADGSRERIGLRNGRGQTMDWFLKRLPLAWLLLTAVIIAAVLYSIHEAGGFH